MRWTSLFADLSSRLDDDARAARDADVAELTRAYAADSTFVDRLRAATGQEVTVHVCTGEPVRGRLEEVAAEWVLLTAPGHQVVVPLHAVDHVTGLGHAAAAPSSTVATRLSLGHVLRRLARDRVVVHVRTRHASVAGRVERVGADHVDVVSAPAWGERGAPSGVRAVVPVASIVLVADQVG